MPAPTRRETDRGAYAVTLAAVVYAILVAIMWGAYNPHSGMSYETGFPYTSSISTFINGFLYGADWLRIHTSTFYNVGYVLAKWLDIDGSYTPYQAVYACLWWARGMLVFLILRRFLPWHQPLCYAAGALVLVHASDGALQWVGQMNQFGFIFWMLLAFYLLIEGCRAESLRFCMLFVVAACFFEQMSILSYESQIFIILVMPAALLVLRDRKRSAAALVWYIIPAIYIALNVRRYLRSHGGTYQEGVMRKTWSLYAIASDWLFNIGASLEFWNWPRNNPAGPASFAAILAVLAAAVFLAGLLLLRRTAKPSDPGIPGAPALRLLLLAGAVLLALSFPAYLLLDSARSLWRTQMLSGIGAGLVWTAALALLARRSRVLSIALIGSIVFFGSFSAIRKGAFHRRVWERHRFAMRELLRNVPGVKRQTIVVMSGVPKTDDPFGDVFWFDLALRLAYPGAPVSGTYVYSDGTLPPGNHLLAQTGRWRWDGGGFPPLIQDAGLDQTIVVHFDPAGASALAPSIPPTLCRDNCSESVYHPKDLIAGPVAPSTIRRYRLDAPPPPI